MSAAEDALRAGELHIAESRYRSALAAGWLLMGTLESVERRLPDARDAFLRASTSTVVTLAYGVVPQARQAERA